MSRRLRTTFAVFLGVLTLALAAPTMASASVISDCTDNNSLEGNYSASDLQRALESVPADVDQYYGCSDLIRQELLNKADKAINRRKGKGGGGAAVNAAATDAQRRRAKRAVERAVDEAVPGGDGALTSADAEEMRAKAKSLASANAPGAPAAMIVALAGLVLLFLGDLASRVATRRSHTGSVDDRS